jgi:DNA polymerase
MIVSIDFETRSVVDLRAYGSYPYARHPSTDILCMAYAIEDDDPLLWWPGDPFPEALENIVCGLPGPDFEFRAWNAQFERLIWQHVLVPRYGFPALKASDWYCTAADAAAMALPRRLEYCADVMGIEEKKDEEGAKVMRRLSRPRSGKWPDVTWWDEPVRGRTMKAISDDYKRLGLYCQQDVRAERAIYKATRRLPESERETFLLDQRINDTGVRIDVDLASRCLAVVEQGKTRANTIVRNVTGGVATTVTQVGKLLTWLQAHDSTIEDVSKATVRDLLEGELPDDVRRVLQARADGAKSSTAKIKKMLGARCEDDRVRGTMLYHGANPGRWAGRIIQVQNFPRGSIKDAEFFIPMILDAVDAKHLYDLLDLYENPLDIVSSLLRAMLVPEKGSVFYVADFEQIEARVLAWIAGQEDMLQIFLSGQTPYKVMGGKIFDMDPSEIQKGTEQYQLGKNMTLGCGYQMGWKRFAEQTQEQQGVVLEPKFAHKVIRTYRDAAPMIVQTWHDFENAAFAAVRERGKTITTHGCKFLVRGAYLYIVLPSKRPLCYAAPSIEEVSKRYDVVNDDGSVSTKTMTKDSVVAWAMNNEKHRWAKRVLYGGMLTENIVQAIARDLLVGAMKRLEAGGYMPVMHAHDEVVCEVLEHMGNLDEFISLMERLPRWAEGCPVSAEGFITERYKK